MKYIDNFLNTITMYRLVLYCLIILLAIASVLSAFDVLSFSPHALIVNIAVILSVGFLTDRLLARIFRVNPNIESVCITALILSLLITPSLKTQTLIFAVVAVLLAISSKYLLAPLKKHLFNPAAFGITIASLVVHGSANWWVGTRVMVPFVLIIGFLIVRKIKREQMVAIFILTALALGIITGTTQHLTIIEAIQSSLLDSPLLFFAFVMLTEPLTTPPRKQHQAIYGGLVALLYSGIISLSTFYFTPELALLAGNLYSYLMSPKSKLKLTLLHKKHIGLNTIDFSFKPDGPMHFLPGQYMEWTILTPHADSRGNRRFFTIASSPTEEHVYLGSKFYDKPSQFKNELAHLKEGDTIITGQLAGDFVMPNDTTKKLVWIAGGIGVTPYRSMAKYLIDTKQKRDIVLFYSNKTAEEIVYRDIFDQAKDNGLKTIYTLTNATPANWSGKTGMISREMIEQEVPDYKDRIFYISGPHALVTAFEVLLKQMGTPRSHIKVDYFPGFA